MGGVANLAPMRDTTRYEISYDEVRDEIEDARKYEIPQSKRYHEIRGITEEVDMPRSTSYEASRSAR